MKPAKDITAADVNLREAHTPNESPATERTVPEWAVKLIEGALIESGKAMHPADTCRYPMDAPRLIAAALLPHLHAPQPPAHGGLVEEPYIIRQMRGRLNDSTLMHINDDERALIINYVAALTTPPSAPGHTGKG